MDEPFSEGGDEIFTENDGSQDGAVDGDDAFVVVLVVSVDDRLDRLRDHATARVPHILI